MTDLTPVLRDLLARQDGVVTRGQLRGAGVTEAAIRWHAGRGWRVLLPGVLLLTRDDPRPRQRLVAGLLWAGDRSVLSGSTAASLHGITSADPRGRVHLLVPAPLASRRSGFAHARRTLCTMPTSATAGRCGCRHRRVRPWMLHARHARSMPGRRS